MLNFVKKGQGSQKIILLHDFFGDHQNYEATFPYLDEAHFTYVFADLRGYGGSRDLEASFSLQQICKDVLELADHLGWERFHLVGHSMSGMYIQKIAAEAPERILSLNAVCPVPACGVSMPPELAMFVRQAIEGNDEFAGQILMGVTENRYSQGFLDSRLKHFRTCATVEARLAYFELFTEQNFADEVQGLKTPVHVILGARDGEHYGVESMKGTFGAYFPNCSISVIDDASHFPMIETPPRFLGLVEGHLLSLQTQENESLSLSNA